MAAKHVPNPLERFITVIQELSLARNIGTVMAIVRHAARALSGADGASFVLREGAMCYYADEDAISPLWKGQRFPMSACISGWVMLNQQAAIVDDIATDPRIPLESYQSTFVKSLVMVPIRPVAPLGAIGIYWARPYCATAEEVKLLQALADSTATAIENVQLYAELEQRVAERTTELGAANEALRREMAERHQAEAEQRRLQREAERMQHFALLGRLAAGIAHEIRNPLGAIFLHADLLEEELRQPSAESAAQVTEALQEIKTQLHRLHDLVQDYLSLVRVTAIERTPQDIGVAVHTWAHEWQELATRQGVQLLLEGLTALGQIALHESTLRRALWNLVQNALDAMPDDGTLTITGHSMATHVQLTVQDTGSSIPAEHLTTIFEPLYTTKPGGTGLAFTSSRRLSPLMQDASRLRVLSGRGQPSR